MSAQTNAGRDGGERGRGVGDRSRTGTAKFSERQRLIQRLINRDGDGCHYCRVTLEPHNSSQYNPRAISVDHMIPQAQGGSSKLENLVLCCISCNLQKKTKSYHEFRFAKETDLLLLFMMDDEL